MAATRNSATASSDVIHNPRQSTSTLESHAATAALYATRSTRQSKVNGQNIVDRNQKLSSAGAAASLKYANPQDLPSYPSAGLKDRDSAANRAANLGWANQKSFEHWKPDPSASASAAAFLAKDYKMAPQWKPEQSSNGARAAVLAARDGRKVEIWEPDSTSVWGNSAAVQAFKKFGAGGLSPVLDYGYTELGRQGSLSAATGAMAKGRRRAQSELPVPVQPPTYPDQANARSNALKAATSAHRQSGRTGGSSEFGSTPYTNMGREMYTSHPPVGPEVEERNRQDTLHASAVAMAKGMYNQQQSQLETSSHAQRGAAAAHGRKASLSSTISDHVPPMRFNNLQEAAKKLAQERLAKLQTEHAKNRDYRDYYGSNDSYRGSFSGASIAPSKRISMRGRARRRPSSDGELDEDREQSNKIRGQMSLFSSNLAQVDEKKRARDREALIAAAQRNVTAKLHGMDEKVFAETGKVAPSLLSEWEVKAHAAAQANSHARMESHGMVHIGGGKYINQSEIDAVAQRNIQPVLDEINEKAEAERERQAALKLEQETQARKEAEKKTREKEAKQINKKLKQQDKDEEKLRKADEKSARKEEERLAKERRKSLKSGGALVAPTTETTAESMTVPVTENTMEPATESTVEAILGPSTNNATQEPNQTTPKKDVPETIPANKTVATTSQESEPATQSREAPTVPSIRTSMEDQTNLRIQQIADAANKDETTPLSPTTPTKSRVKSWLKAKLRSSKSKKSTSPEKTPAKEEKFVGGAALTRADANNSSDSLGHNSTSMRDVALATSQSKNIVSNTVPSTVAPTTSESREIPVSEYLARPSSVLTAESEEERVGRPTHRASDVSSVSSLEDDVEGGDDDFQEARDNFDEDLAPPPTFGIERNNSNSSPVRDSKFKEEI